MFKLPPKSHTSSHSTSWSDSPADHSSIESSSATRTSHIASNRLHSSSEVRSLEQKPLTKKNVTAIKLKTRLREKIKRIQKAIASFFKELSTSLPGRRFAFEIEINNQLMEIHTNGRPISKKKSMEIFKAITDSFGPQINELKIIAKNNPASDSGGPKREFFSHLVTTILNESPLSNLFSQETSGAVLTKAPSKKEEHDALHRLGKILGLCLNFDIQIGHIIDRSTFTVISTIIQNPQTYSEPINLNDEKDFNIYFELYKLLESQQKDRKETLSRFEEALSSPETREDTKDAIIVALENKVIPLIELSKEIAETMSAESKNLVLQSPEILPDKILGMHLDAKGLLDQIEFDESKGTIPNDRKKWINDWISDRSPEEIKSFIYAMTGSPTLSSATKIKFTQTEHLKFLENNPTFEINTCFRLLWMDYTQVESEELMRGILDMILSTSGFNAK